MEFKGQYLTYTEYQDLGGTLKEMPFNILEFKARKQVDNMTFNRLVNLEEQNQEVKMCEYELINKLEEYIKTADGTKTSESIDGYSVSYTQIDINERKREYGEIIRNYLGECKLEDGTPYLYCGVEDDN